MRPFWLKNLLSTALCSTVLSVASAGAQPTDALVCQDWRRFADADLSAHATTLAALNVCFQYEPVMTKGIVWRVLRLQRQALVPNPAPLLVVLHDNEDAALAGALSVLAVFDVQIVTIDTAEQRLWQGVDPNRMFVEPGAIINGCPHRDQLDAAFAAAILRDWSGRDPVLSLHTNAPGIAGDGQGGRGSISLLKLGPNQRAFPGQADPHAPRLRDPDNLIYITGPSPQPGPEQALRIAHLQAAGLNVLYSQIDPTAQDCSLSDFLTLRGQSDLYFNIEVEEGDFDSAQRMVRRLINVLYSFPSQSSGGA